MPLFNSWSWQMFMFYACWVVSLSARYVNGSDPPWWRCVNLWGASRANEITTKLQSLNAGELRTVA